MSEKTHPSAWIQTYTGRKVDLIWPTPDMIAIEDIAHALSLICRYTGHTRFHYSVAQHSALCAKVVPQEFAFEALMHDAAEAYVNDLASPLKWLVPAYSLVEDRFRQVIVGVFGLADEIPDVVKAADLAVLMAEKRDLFRDDLEWEVHVEPAHVSIVPMEWFEAKSLFLRLFHELRGD
jgi:hypothetical protein